MKNMIETPRQEIRKITLSDGRPYSIRADRRKIFTPDVWKIFINSLRKKNRHLFEFMINTGSRIDEAIHIRPKDFDFERNNVRLWKTKTKSKKGETVGQPRTVSLSSEFTKRMGKFCKDKNPDNYLFVGSKGNPLRQQGTNQLMKRRLKENGVEDFYNYSTHNIRKTHGMYLKALGIEMGEICLRLGHDYNTYIKHYGSADIFNETDMRGIREIIGDLYIRQRRY